MNGKIAYQRQRIIVIKHIPSMSSQCPVSTQMHTIDTANEKLNSSAAVNRPQNPNDIRLPSEQGRMIY